MMQCYPLFSLRLRVFASNELRFSVKEMAPKANESLTGEGHAGTADALQALAGLTKPNLIRAFFQRGALR